MPADPRRRVHFLMGVELPVWAEPAETAQYIADVISADFPVQYVQQTTDGVAEVGFERFCQVAAGHTPEHDLKHHGAQALMWMASRYTAASLSAMNSYPPVHMPRNAWVIPAGKTPRYYAAVAAALCAAAIDTMEKDA